MEVPVNCHVYIPPQIFCLCFGWHFIHSNIACVRQWSGMEALAVWSPDIEAGCWNMKCHLSGGEGVCVSVWGWEILATVWQDQLNTWLWFGTSLLERSWTVYITAPSSHSVILLGDFNTHVDNGSETWRGVNDPNQIRVLFLASVQITVCSYWTQFLNIRVPICRHSTGTP